jgi:hypothetical protein
MSPSSTTQAKQGRFDGVAASNVPTPSASRCFGVAGSAILPLHVVVFSLDTTGSSRHNARQHFVSWPARERCDAPPGDAQRAGPWGKTLCSICRVSRCSASIRNATLAVIGCAPTPPAPSVMTAAAPAVAICSETSRHRWVRVSACARGRSRRARRFARDPARLNFAARSSRGLSNKKTGANCLRSFCLHQCRTSFRPGPSPPFLHR